MARTKQTARKGAAPKAALKKKSPAKKTGAKKPSAPRRRSPEKSEAALKRAYESLEAGKAIDVSELDDAGGGFRTVKQAKSTPSAKFYAPGLPALVSNNKKHYERALEILGLDKKKYYAGYEQVAGAQNATERAKLLGTKGTTKRGRPKKEVSEAGKKKKS